MMMDITNGAYVTYKSKRFRSMLEKLTKLNQRVELSRYFEYHCKPIMQDTYIYIVFIQVLSVDIP